MSFNSICGSGFVFEFFGIGFHICPTPLPDLKWRPHISPVAWSPGCPAARLSGSEHQVDSNHSDNVSATPCQNICQRLVLRRIIITDCCCVRMSPTINPNLHIGLPPSHLSRSQCIGWFPALGFTLLWFYCIWSWDISLTVWKFVAQFLQALCCQ